jgi:two-component system cell cycle response regulator
MSVEQQGKRKAPLVATGVDAELLSAAVAIHAHLELKDLLQLLLDYAVSWVGVDCAVALAPGGERPTWSPIAATIPKDDARRAALGTVDPEAVRHALAERGRRFDGLGPFGSKPGAEGLPRYTIAVPVTDTGENWVALLALLSDSEPDEVAVDRLSRLILEIRPALDNARSAQAMRELVIKDDTAHCFNRRYFESCLPEELSRANRFHAALSLIFLDMDNLKEVNQRHGHAAGSRTLREVSRRIRVKIRRFDKLFRFGGDEFCIVLPETEWHGALEVAERVRDSIAGQPFLMGQIDDPAGIGMTASLGIAAFPVHARTQEDLIEQSDRAMQRIKRGTKNSIGIAEILGGGANG